MHEGFDRDQYAQEKILRIKFIYYSGDWNYLFVATLGK